MPFGRKSPLEALALPGVILAYKYSQFRQRRREAASRRVTERELSALHHKIDKLLSKLEESEPEPPTSQEDECVICINARATMQTSPCGHRVVCRRCFVKTIQSAVAQRLLPLRCVICRARVNRLTSSSGSWRIQESASSYSVGAKSWTSGGVPQSASSYSVGGEGSGHHHHHHHHQHHYGHGRVAQSASLYSMSSGSSSLSSASNITSCSNTSSASSGAESSSGLSTNGSSIHNSHRLLSNGNSTTGSNNRSQPQLHHHHHHPTCANGCLGAVPRKPSVTPLYIQMSNLSSSSTNTYPGRRYGKGRIADLQNRLPPIKEFKSPAKVPHPSPVHISNPRFRYASYTKSSSSHETAPLLKDPSPVRNSQSSNMIATKSSSKTSGGLTSKVSPMNTGKVTIQKTLNGKTDSNSSSGSSKTFPLFASKLVTNCTGNNNSSCNSSNNNNNSNNSNNNNNNNINNSSSTMIASISTSRSSSSSSSTSSSSTSKNFHNSHDEKIDNKKNETMEKKKKEEKLKAKAEKEARKEEKRLAKEEERLAKIQAKEEKKKLKREAKELLLANDGNRK